MPVRPLPRPVSATEMYLAAILDELRALRLPAESLPEGVQRLREPAAPVSPPDASGEQRDDLEDLSMAELREIAAGLGAPSARRKAQLIANIREAQQ